MKRLSKHLFLFLVGGLIYYGIEMLWRGHSHILMAMVGGICFLLVGGNSYIKEKVEKLKQEGKL